MSFPQRLTQAGTHQKLIRQILTWLVLLDILFMIFYAILAFRITENRLVAENTSLIRQTRHSVDDLYQRVQAISSQILQDPLATAYLYERNSYALAKDSLTDLLVGYAKSHPLLLRYIGLYNGYLGTYETSIGTLPASQMGLPVGNSAFSLRPREIRIDSTALEALKNEFTRLIVFYARVEDNPQRTNQGLVVMNIDADKFSALLTDYRPEAHVYLTDAHGIVLASNEPAAFITDLSFGHPFSGIFQNESGTRHLSDSGLIRSGHLWRRQLTCYQHSPVSGLFTVVVLDAGLIWLEYGKAVLPVLLASSLFVLALIWLLAQQLTRFCQPLHNLVHEVAGPDVHVCDEYQVLHQALMLGDQTARIAREKFLADFLSGKFSHEDAARMRQILSQLESPAYLLVVGRFDGFWSLAETNPDDLDNFRFVVINITQELLADIGPATGLVTGDQEVTLILQLTQAGQPAALEERLTQAQAQIRRYFPFTVSFAFGSVLTQFEQFSDSYQQTCKLFSYRLYFGPNSLLTPERTVAVNRTIRYPALAEKRILEALNLRRQDLLLSGIDEFMQAVREGYSPRTINYFNQLLFSVFKQVDNTVELVDDDYDNYLETSDRLSRCDQLDDARAIITRFCLELMSISQEKSRRATDVRHERLHDELIRFLRENLGDPGLSLESVAERFNLSAGYLGKLVKTASGENFSSLLAAMRLEKAAQLLIETSQPAYKIAEQVGIPNVAYFSTLFKRRYGLSPAPFREKRGNLGQTPGQDGLRP